MSIKGPPSRNHTFTKVRRQQAERASRTRSCRRMANSHGSLAHSMPVRVQRQQEKAALPASAQRRWRCVPRMLLQMLGWVNGEFVWPEREREHQCRAPCHVGSLSREREGTAESVKEPAGSEVSTRPVPDEVHVERRDARAVTPARVEIMTSMSQGGCSAVRTSSDPECAARKSRPK